MIEFLFFLSIILCKNSALVIRPVYKQGRFQIELRSPIISIKFRKRIIYVNKYETRGHDIMLLNRH